MFGRATSFFNAALTLDRMCIQMRRMIEIHPTIFENHMIGQGKIDTLRMLAKCFTILANLFYKRYKCLGMLANACECCCESYECVANETRTQRICNYFT